MNPRTHPRGAPPDFTLPHPNPNPARMTDALWWLVCMRLALEPTSRNGGTFADKPGYHNAGENLPDHGQGDSRTDHSIRRAPDRTGPWWRTKTAAHDWTFENAHHGDYTEIQLYTRRLITAMRDPDDLRPDDVYAYTLGQTDGDPVVEGYNEYTDDPDTSADKSHLWHRHDSFRRHIIGDYAAMWKALTIDMGWTHAEWQQSLEDDMPLTDADAKKVADKVWGDKRWASATPVSMADAAQQAARADDALREVQALRAEVAELRNRPPVVITDQQLQDAVRAVIRQLAAGLA